MLNKAIFYLQNITIINVSIWYLDAIELCMSLFSCMILFYLSIKFCKKASRFYLENYMTIQTIITLDWLISWIIIQLTRLVTCAIERAEEKVLFANGSVFRRRSNETRNPSANGMQSNPFVEFDLASVNRNCGKSAPNNAAPRDRRQRNCRTNRRFSDDSQVPFSFSLKQIVTSVSESEGKQGTDR